MSHAHYQNPLISLNLNQQNARPRNNNNNEGKNVTTTKKRQISKCGRLAVSNILPICAQHKCFFFIFIAIFLEFFTIDFFFRLRLLPLYLSLEFFAEFRFVLDYAHCPTLKRAKWQLILVLICLFRSVSYADVDVDCLIC